MRSLGCPPSESNVITYGDAPVNIVGEMKWFLGEDNYAQLKFSESKTSFSLDIVMVPSAHRSKGIGTVLINRLLFLADTMKKDVYVSARPIGNNSSETLNRLVRYYERFGFVKYDKGQTTVYMVRKGCPTDLQNENVLR